MSLVLICADLVLQDSFTCVTHTSHTTGRRREESEVEGNTAEMANETVKEKRNIFY